MASSTQQKGRKSVTITIGFPAAAGSASYAAGGVIVAGTTEYEVEVEPGDLSVPRPGYGKADPLDRGEFVSGSAPFRTDAQAGEISWTQNFRFITDPTQLDIMDIVFETGAAAALNSEISGSEMLLGSVKIEWANPGNPADVHGMVYQECSFEADGPNDGDPATISVRAQTRSVTPAISY